MKGYISEYTGQEIDQRLADVSGKQDELVSGENIKKLAGQDLLGSGDVVKTISIDPLWQDTEIQILFKGETDSELPKNFSALVLVPTFNVAAIIEVGENSGQAYDFSGRVDHFEKVDYDFVSWKGYGLQLNLPREEPDSASFQPSRRDTQIFLLSGAIDASRITWSEGASYPSGENPQPVMRLYNKPTTGIPKTDLATAVQTSLGKADSAVQNVKTLAGTTLKGSGDVVQTFTLTTATQFELLFGKGNPSTYTALILAQDSDVVCLLQVGANNACIYDYTRKVQLARILSTSEFAGRVGLRFYDGESNFSGKVSVFFIAGTAVSVGRGTGALFPESGTDIPKVRPINSVKALAGQELTGTGDVVKSFTNIGGNNVLLFYKTRPCTALITSTEGDIRLILQVGDNYGLYSLTDADISFISASAFGNTSCLGIKMGSGMTRTLNVTFLSGTNGFVSTYPSPQSVQNLTINHLYSKPSDGIPATDLASGVRTSLSNADNAIQGTVVSDISPIADYVSEELRLYLAVQPTMKITWGRGHQTAATSKKIYVSHPLMNYPGAEIVLLNYRKKNGTRPNSAQNYWKFKKGYSIATPWKSPDNYFVFSAETPFSDMVNFLESFMGWNREHEQWESVRRTGKFGVALRIPNPAYDGPVSLNKNNTYHGVPESLWSDVLPTWVAYDKIEQTWGIGIK